jgi:glycosyltransferase involved in cell wall biosynthesis
MNGGVAGGETALLARPLDTDDLGRQMARIMTDPTLAARLGAGGQAFARERFDLSRNTQRLEDVYDQISAMRERRP